MLDSQFRFLPSRPRHAERWAAKTIYARTASLSFVASIAQVVFGRMPGISRDSIWIGIPFGFIPE
jgi:hypothetical protein